MKIKPKQFAPINVHYEVRQQFDRMVAKSKLSKSDFLQVLMNIFNEHDIGSRTVLVSGSSHVPQAGSGVGHSANFPPTSNPTGIGYGTGGLSPTSMEVPEAEEETD